jgi:endonuclease/exonuclease/phosphatase family metal-dependent hydrolase
VIRVVTWTLGGSPTTAAVRAVLRRLQPDLLLLPDQPSRFQLRRCLAGTGLRPLSRQGRGRAGSVVCGSGDVRLVTAAELVLPGPAEGAERVASHAILSASGRTLSVMAFRLGTDPGARLADAELAAAFLDRIEHPAVVGADLAEGPGGPVATALMGGRVDAWTVAGVGTGLTYPTPNPVARHDVVLVDAGLTVTAATVVADPPADEGGRHRPVVVEIELEETS